MLEALGSEVVEQRFSPDDRHTIVKEIHYLLEQRYDMIVVTGGMSVDPDDRTPAAIKEAGANIVSYGTPMLPGSMLLIGYLEGVPIMGLPGCVMHDPYTSFDVLLPRILAGDVITRKNISGTDGLRRFTRLLEGLRKVSKKLRLCFRVVFARKKLLRKNRKNFRRYDHV